MELNPTTFQDIINQLKNAHPATTKPATAQASTQTITQTSTPATDFATLLSQLKADNPATNPATLRNHRRAINPNHLNGAVKVRTLTEQELEAIRATSANHSSHYTKPLRSYTLKRYQEPLVIKPSVVSTLMKQALKAARQDAFPADPTSTDLAVSLTRTINRHYKRVFSPATINSLVVTTLGEGRDYVAR